MRRSFLARFRGSDARSLAKALALLLVFNAVFGAFHSSAMAQAAEAGTVLCAPGGSLPDLPASPADRAEMSCCVFGHAPASLALPPQASLSFDGGFAIPSSRTPPVEAATLSSWHGGSVSSRGPPLLV